jgi:hypothetical protein
MKCKICKQNSITPLGTCSNIQCTSNKNRELTSVDILEGHINQGTIPSSVGTERDNKGGVRTVFRWDCGTFLHMRYEFNAYLITLARFLDFWGTCLPSDKLDKMNIKEKPGGGTGGGE